MLQFLGLFSFVAFIGSLIVVPWLIGRMQPDYFLTHWQKVETRHRRHPVLALGIMFLRNGVGLVLMLAGIAMLVLPGQGLLTMLIGLCLMDFPSKRRLIDRLAGIPQVRQALNWVRRKQGKDEFIFAGKIEASGSRADQ
jgi:hypothetical protein